MKKKQIIQAAIVCILLLLLGGYMEYSQHYLDEKNRIIRGSPGSGDQKLELTLDAGDNIKDYNYEVTVPAERADAQMAEKYFADAKKEIEKNFFSDGDKPDHVTDPVHMKTSYAGHMVEAEWMLDRYDVVDVDGSICARKIKKEGEIVQATVELACGEYLEQYAFSFSVYPKPLSQKEQIIEEISSSVEEQSTQEGKQYLKLPDQAAGVRLHWKEKKQHLVGKIFFFEILVIFLMGVVLVERKKTTEKDRKNQMALDYAELISKLLVLLGAGMSLKQAWNKISAQYFDKRQKKETKERFIYEEMLITNREILDGESERCAYQKFAERVDLGTYQRMIRILLQNLQTGSKGLCELLAQESEAAMEERKALARKLGEEAGTKMLLPLVMMLGIVIAIIMVPAILSFQI